MLSVIEVERWTEETVVAIQYFSVTNVRQRLERRGPDRMSVIVFPRSDVCRDQFAHDAPGLDSQRPL